MKIVKNKQPKTWRKVKLGELADITSSKRIYLSDYVKSGIPFFRSKEIIEKHDSQKISTELYISEEKFKRIKEVFGAPVENDLLLTSVGTIGVPYLVKKDDKFYFKDGNLIWFRNFKNSNPKFIYYWFESRFGKEAINSIMIGSSQSAITIVGLKNLEILAPSSTEQNSIVSILSAFDDKIEVNNKISKNLEEMAQAIFKEWFVDFRLSRYKKTKFVNSELGKIPKGWEVKKITEIIKRLPVGKKYDNKNALPKGEIPILDQGQSGFIGYHDGEPGVRASIESPVAVFTNHTCYYRLMTQNFSCIQNVIPYIGDKGYPTLFVYFLTKGKIKMQEYKGHWPEFEEQIFTIPPVSFAQKFSDYIQPIIKKMVGVEKENQKLAALRDLLLPKLMSGEIKL